MARSPQAGGGGLGSYPDLVRDMLSQDVNAAISASKNLLAIAESTQVSEKLSVDVLSQLLQALRSPHTQVLCNITSIMFWVAYGNAENQRALIGLPNFLPAMAAIIRPKPGEQVVRQEQANAVHALSQVVFADADTAVSIVSTPGILSGMVSMMTIGASRPTARTARDIAALAVNNCAGIGGEDASAKIAAEPGMLDLLKTMALQGAGEERTRATSVWYHISRSPQAQAQMLAADVPATLLQVLSVRGTGDEYDAHIGLATMALANLVGSAPKGPIKGEAVEFVVRFLGYAVKAQRFGGISWRVDDVLNPLLIMSVNSGHHASMAKAGLIPLTLRLLDDWKPGMHDAQFTKAKAARVPIIEKATQLLANLAKTPECLQTLHVNGAPATVAKLQEVGKGVPRVQDYAALLVKALEPPKGVAVETPAKAPKNFLLNTPAGKAASGAVESVKKKILTPPSPMPTDDADEDMWKIKAQAYAKRNEVLASELEEAEQDILLLREELSKAEEERREMNGHVDKVENQLRSELNKVSNDLMHAQESEAALKLEIQRMRAEFESKTLAGKKAQYEEKEVLGEEIDALQKQITTLLKQQKEDKKKIEQLTTQVAKDTDSHAFELSGYKAKLDAEKKNSTYQIELLKKQIKVIEEEAEAMNMEKGIQSRWITDQKQTLEKEIAELEDEREGLLSQLDDMDASLKSKMEEAEELNKHLAGLQSFADDLHVECDSLLQRETRIVALEINTMDQEVTFCPEDTAEYREQLALFLAQKVKCNPDRLCVLPTFEKSRGQYELSHESKHTVIYVQVTPALHGPMPVQGFLGQPARLVAEELERMARDLDIRTLPQLKLHDHYKPVRQAQRKISHIREVHRLVETSNISHKEAKKRVKLGGSNSHKSAEPTPMTVTPTVKKSKLLQGADAVDVLNSRIATLERRLWAKHVQWETNIVHVFDRMYKRKGWMQWLDHWNFEKKGLRIMRRVLLVTAWKALRQWESFHAEEKHRRMAGLKLLRQWMNKSIHRAFNSWLEAHKEEKRKRFVMQKIVTRWQKGSMAIFFEYWHYTSTTEGRYERIGGAIARRWMNLSLEHALNKWVSEHREEMHHRKIMLKIMHRWHGGIVEKHFEIWKDHTGDEAHFQRVGVKIAARWMNLTLEHAFNKWLSEHRLERQHLMLMRKIAGRWMKREMSICWSKWKDSVFMELKLSDILEVDDKLEEIQGDLAARIAELKQVRQENEDAIARLTKLNDLMLAEKENEIRELQHAVSTSHETLLQRKDVIELQQKQLEEESRKHHAFNEQLNIVEAELRQLKSENLNLTNSIQALEAEHQALQKSSQATELQLTTERDNFKMKLVRLTDDKEMDARSFQQQEAALSNELSALENALRNKERELSVVMAEREEAEARAIMELDSARQTLANSEKKIKDMTARMQEQHNQIMWLDDSLQKEKKKAAASGGASPLTASGRTRSHNRFSGGGTGATM